MGVSPCTSEVLNVRRLDRNSPHSTSFSVSSQNRATVKLKSKISAMSPSSLAVRLMFFFPALAQENHGVGHTKNPIESAFGNPTLKRSHSGAKHGRLLRRIWTLQSDQHPPPGSFKLWLAATSSILGMLGLHLPPPCCNELPSSTLQSRRSAPEHSGGECLNNKLRGHL